MWSCVVYRNTKTVMGKCSSNVPQMFWNLLAVRDNHFFERDNPFKADFLVKKPELRSSVADAKSTTPSYFLGPTFIGIIMQLSALSSKIWDLPQWGRKICLKNNLDGYRCHQFLQYFILYQLWLMRFNTYTHFPLLGELRTFAHIFVGNFYKNVI